MTAPSSDWLESVCQLCGLPVRFQASQVGTTGYCPHCKQTITLTEATPAQLAAATSKARTERKKLPVWLVWMVWVCLGSLVLTVALVAMGNWLPTLGFSEFFQFYGWFMFIGTFVIFCGAGLWVLFLVYVFMSLTEMRSLLREIATDTRNPKSPLPPVAHGGQSVGLLPSKPLIPTEDAKYLPKGS